MEWNRPLPAGSSSVVEPESHRGSNVSDFSGIARIFETVRRFRESPGAMYGPCGVEDVVIVGDDSPGEVVVFDRDTTIIGDICIVNRGELRVEGADLTLVGDITIQHGGRMLVSGGGFHVPEEFRQQYGCLVVDSARFEIDDSEVTFNRQNWGLTCAGNAYVRVDNCTFPSGIITALLLQESTMEVSRCKKPGEFIPMENSEMTISNCDSAIAWFTFPVSSGGTFEAPARDTLVGHYEFPTPSVTGVDYRFVIDSTLNVLPGLLCSEEISLTVENSDVVALGVIFWEGTGDTIRIEGLVNDTDYTDFTPDLLDRTLRLVDTHVSAWNFYPFDTTILRMENDIFGEIMVTDSSRTDIYYSICDGTGGHVMSQSKSELLAVFTSMVAQVIARNRSLMLFFGTSFPSSGVSADGSAVMMFLNSAPAMRPTVLDTALTLEMFVGLPSAPRVDSDVPVTGTALVTPGPHNRLSMDHYLLDWAAGVDPQSTEWTRIDSVGGSVFQDTLGIWDTRGLDPGYHMLRLTVRSAYVDTFRLDMPLVVYVTLNESIGIGEKGREIGIPRATALLQNVPNPFNPSTDIRFALAEGGAVQLRVFDVRGRLVRVLVDGDLQPGEHTAHWDGKDGNGVSIPSGVYICALQTAAGERFTRKMVLAK